MMGTTGCNGRTGRSGRWTHRSIYSLSEWVHLRVFGRSFWHPPRVILESMLNNFGGLGNVLETLSPPGTLEGGMLEKGTEKVVRGSFVGPRPRPPLDPTLRKSRSEKHAGKHCAQSAAQEMSRDPLQHSESWFRQHETLIFTLPAVGPKLLEIASNA